METARRTHCGRLACPGTVARRELVTSRGYWMADMAISYRCGTCGREEIVDLGLNARMKKRLAKVLRDRRPPAL